MFETIQVKKLKKLVSDFKKANNVVGSVSKLKKAELVKLLEKHFVLQNDKLVLKTAQAVQPVQPVQSVQSVQPFQQPNFNNNNNGLTAGQQRFNSTINQIENRANARERYMKDNQLSRRILKR